MENLTIDEPYSKSRILFLPFISQVASDYNTLYATLNYIIDDGNKYGHSFIIVTFDQPLF